MLSRENKSHSFIVDIDVRYSAITQIVNIFIG